jgi:aminoglycoside/choline kinase family phosphotransferase
MVAIPGSAAEATADWLADALQKGGAPVAGRITAVKPEPRQTEAGVFGEVVRLRLSYDHSRSADPRSLILKLPSRSPVNDARARRFRLYEREVRFYQTVARGLHLRIPRCHWSHLDSRGGEFALLLEDLGHMQTGDERPGISGERATLAVERLAHAHAQWWESPTIADLDWMPRLSSPTMAQLAHIVRDSWTDFVERGKGHLPPEHQALGEQVRDCFEELLAQMSQPPLTIAHCDFRVDNLLFGESWQDAVAVIDWQLASLGRGAFDVAHLLCRDLTVAHRRRHESAILRRWHRALTSHGVNGYSFRDAVTDYRRAALICVGYAVAGTALDGGDRRAQARAWTQAVRAFTAVADLAADSSIHELIRGCNDQKSLAHTTC